MEQFHNVVRFFSIAAPAVGIILYVSLKKFDEKAINYLLLMMVVSFVADVTSYFFAQAKISSIEIANVYFMIQLILVGLIYNQIFTEKSRILAVLISVSELLILVNALIFQSFDTFQNIGWVISILAIMAIAFSHFAMMAGTPVLLIKKYPPFWISTGIFFYCSLGFIIFTTSRYLATNYSLEDFRLVWMFHNIMNIFKNLCFAVAIWWSAKRDAEIDKLITVYDKAS